jgi:hypothetical protein
MNNSKFPPVEWVSPLEPFSSPTNLNPGPHNLPRDLLRRATGVGAPNTVPGFDPAATYNVRDLHRYATLTDLSLVVGTTSVKFLDEPTGRRNMLGFRNASTAAQILYIGFNQAASTTSWLELTAGTIVLFDDVVPQDDLYVISSGAGGILAYAYSNFGG